jgi:hypothetical protein
VRQREENLAALRPRQPALASSIQATAPDPRLVRLQARDGMIVPGVRSSTGTVPLHSLYDPRQESARLAESLRGAGCLVVCGLGAGYHVSALLDDPGVRVLMVVEKDAAVLRSLFEQFPLARLLRDDRVILMAGLEQIRPTVLSSWQPAVMGGMRTVPLRPWCEQERSFFDAAAAEIQAAIEAVRGDYSVQSHFGKRWLTNILLNLHRLEKPSRPLPHGASAAVTAAGPSLELQMPALIRERDRVLLVATDTSLPALVRWGVRPDAVLSIDCQNHGYHHFLQGMPAGTTLFLDCASPPVLARRLEAPIFVGSGHPFVRYIDAHWRGLLRIDTSGGNVAHAAVSLARALGARRIFIYGADFSYPAGKAYARGTYLYDYFWTDQSRVSTSESRFFSFVHSSAQARREIHGGKTIYTTPLLHGYRERFMSLMASIDAEVIPVTGDGLDLTPGRKAFSEGEREVSPTQVLQGDVPKSGWKEFLADYASEIGRLPSWSSASNARELDLWSTILPVAAQVVREGALPGDAALEEARGWSLERISRVTQNQGSVQRTTGAAAE